MRRVIGTSGALCLGLSGCLLFTSLSDLSDDDGGASSEVESGVDAPPALDAPNPITDGAGISDTGLDTNAPLDAAADVAVIPAFVQTTASGGSDASVATVTFDAGVTAGNAIVVAFRYASSPANILSINDTQNDTFVPVHETTGPNGNRYFLRAALGVAGGPTNITVQISDAVNGIELYVHEYANVSAIGVAASASGTTKVVDGMLTPLLTTTVPNELVFGYGTSVGGTALEGTAFTARSRFNSNITEDRIAATPGEYRAIGTQKSGTEWTLIGATFKPK